MNWQLHVVVSAGHNCDDPLRLHDFRLLGEGAIKAALDKYHRMWFFVGSLVKSQGGSGGGGALGMVPNKDEKALTDGERDEAMALVSRPPSRPTNRSHQ
jgi:hypothetical protein